MLGTEPGASEQQTFGQPESESININSMVWDSKLEGCTLVRYVITFLATFNLSLPVFFAKDYMGQTGCKEKG